MKSASEFKARYAAWVPNVSGHLSFSVIGTDLPGSKVRFNNTGCGTAGAKLAVITAQSRRNPDSTRLVYFAGRVLGASIRRLSEKRGFIWLSGCLHWFPEGQAQTFVMVGSPVAAVTPFFDRSKTFQTRSDELGALLGTVYIVGEEDRFSFRREQRAVLQEQFDKIEQLNYLDTSSKQYADILSDIEAALHANASYAVNFKLYRSGECELSAVGADPAAISERAENIVTRHTYYFIRDCAHRHYHHRRTDDRLLPAVKIERGGDITWRRETLWALTRTVAEYRRSNAIVRRRQALGVIAYADAFQSTLARIIRKNDGDVIYLEDNSLERFDFQHLRESIKAANETSAWKRQGQFAISGLIVATILSLTSLWVGLSRLGDTSGWSYSGLFVDLLNWIYLHPLHILVSIVTTLLAMWDIVYEDSSRIERVYKTVLAATWPGRRIRRGAGLSYYVVLITLFIVLMALLFFQLSGR